MSRFRWYEEDHEEFHRNYIRLPFNFNYVDYDVKRVKGLMKIEKRMRR